MTYFERGDLVCFTVNINDGAFETGKEIVRGRVLSYDGIGRCLLIQCLDNVTRYCPIEKVSRVRPGLTLDR